MELLPALPNRTGGFPASGFPVSGSCWAGSGTRCKALGSNAPTARSSRSAHPFQGGPLVTDNRHPSESSSHRCAKPRGTTSALVSGIRSDGHHHVPTSLRSTVVTRFLATTDALTPTGPFVAASRGSLIHVALTSNHAVSNHLRFSAGRGPLPRHRQHYFVRASPFR